jgi:hypothetical protein
MNKNILIRDLTPEQNERLALLQKKFGVKTNSQAMLMLLRYCVFTDDELTTMMEIYEEVGKFCFAAMQELKKEGRDAATIEKLVQSALTKSRQMSYLLSLKK